MTTQCPFETRLQELGQCVNDLTAQVQHIKSIFNICLEDYNKKKVQESATKTQNPIKPQIPSNIERKAPTLIAINELAPAPQNLTPKNQKEEEIHENEVKSYTEEMKSGIDINIKNRITNTKRRAPESLIPINELQIYKENTNNLDTNKITNNNIPPNHKKSHERKFSTLTLRERKRIVCESIECGYPLVQRKWGISRSSIRDLLNKEKFFQTPIERNIWMSTQKELIYNKICRMDINTVIKNIENALHGLVKVKKKNKLLITIPPIKTLNELSDYAFDRGIGVAAARYGVDLFELEFMLQTLCGEKWREMDENKWFSVCHMVNGVRSFGMSKLDIVKLSMLEGVEYASKVSGASEFSVGNYRLIYEEYGEEGLKKRENHVSSLKGKIRGTGSEDMGVKMEDNGSVYKLYPSHA